MNNIFLLNFFLTIIEAYFFLFNNSKYKTEFQTKRDKLIFIVLVCVQWILISGLRADSVGSDTGNYAIIYEEHKHISWNDIITSFKNFFSSNDGMSVDFEPGYLIFEKTLHAFGVGQTGYKFVVAIIFMTAFGKFVYENSENPFLTFMMYDGMLYFMFSLTGYRQVVSIAIGLLLNYNNIKNRNFFRFCILAFIGILLHKSTMVVFVFYFLSQKKITKGYLFGTLVVTLIMIVFRNQLFQYVKFIMGYERYAGMDNFTQRNFLFMYSVLAGLALLRYDALKKTCTDINLKYNGLAMSAFLLPFAMVNPTSMRLVYDFLFIVACMLPEIFKSFEKREDKLIVYGASILVFMYFIANKTPVYEFFWQ